MESGVSEAKKIATEQGRRIVDPVGDLTAGEEGSPERPPLLVDQFHVAETDVAAGQSLAMTAETPGQGNVIHVEACDG